MNLCSSEPNVSELSCIFSLCVPNTIAELDSFTVIMAVAPIIMQQSITVITV